jgi:hypothetical protein
MRDAMHLAYAPLAVLIGSLFAMAGWMDANEHVERGRGGVVTVSTIHVRITELERELERCLVQEQIAKTLFQSARSKDAGMFKRQYVAALGVTDKVRADLTALRTEHQ